MGDTAGPYRRRGEMSATSVDLRRFKVAAGTRRVFAKITGGYATIPDDIKLVVLDIVKMIWDSGKTSFGLKREQLGDYEYEKFGAIQSLQGNKELMARIASYRNDLY